MVRMHVPGTLAVVAGTALALAAVVPAAATTAQPARSGQAMRQQVVAAPSACALGPARSVRHVIYLQFDKVHLSRDNPNVPSDLQQMPALLRFLTGNGTLVTHEHTPLIAHTADDIVTSESGLYGSHQGMPIANTYNYYRPGGTTDTAGSFAYWTDPHRGLQHRARLPPGRRPHPDHGQR